MTDINAISELAVKVNTAYKAAPNDHQRVAEEAKSLQTLINKAEQHFGSTTLSSDDRQDGQEVLEGCRDVLQNLHTILEKYKRLASANASTNTASAKTSQAFKKVKLGIEDISTLRANLRSYTKVLNDFVQRFDIPITYYNIVHYANNPYLRCEFLEMQARLTDALGLNNPNSKVPLDSIRSFVVSTNTKRAFRKFCKDLHQIGVSANVITQKEREILNICKPQSAATSGGQSQLPPVSDLCRNFVIRIPYTNT